MKYAPWAAYLKTIFCPWDMVRNPMDAKPAKILSFLDLPQIHLER
jgi:hypothetical protein